MGLWELGQNLTFLMLKLCAFKKGNPGTVICYIYIYIYIFGEWLGVAWHGIWG